jgi:hypothetical protein
MPVHLAVLTVILIAIIDYSLSVPFGRPYATPDGFRGLIGNSLIVLILVQKGEKMVSIAFVL